MPVYYDSAKIIPAPLVTINKNYETTTDGEHIGSIFEITLTGTLVAYKGSPQSGTLSGAGWGGPFDRFWTVSDEPPDETISSDERLKSILRKQDALRELFSNEGRSFEIQPLDGSSVTKCNPRIKSITFEEGVWFNVCNYTIVLEADIVYFNGVLAGEDNFDYLVSKVSEKWTVDDGNLFDTFSLTHEVSATGKRFYDEEGDLVREGWEEARNWVNSRLGLDLNVATESGSIGLTGVTAYNHGRVDSLDKKNGEFSVTESWVLSTDSAVEEFTVNVTVKNEDNVTTVGIEGTINGLAENDNVFQGIHVEQYNNALSKFNSVQPNLLSRAQSYSGVSLNPDLLSSAVAHSPSRGEIVYNFVWDDRPSSCIEGSRNELITIIDENPADVFAMIPVLGRAEGPVLQDISTKKERRRQVIIEAAFDPKECDPNGKPDTSVLLESLKPSFSFQIFTESDSETWTFTNGKYSRNTSWVYE